jgi:hypothetical protein
MLTAIRGLSSPLAVPFKQEIASLSLAMTILFLFLHQIRKIFTEFLDFGACHVIDIGLT